MVIRDDEGAAMRRPSKCEMSDCGKHPRWLMISLTFFATLINYLDRQTLSVVAPVLRDQFHMDSIGYSRVVSAFLPTYTIMNGFYGPLTDRLGTRTG
jgi:ACS family hexuronate transporter-like MFS transporter